MMKFGIAVVGLMSLALAGAASAAPPRSATYDKVKVCSNDTHDVEVRYDLFDYANGSGNKIIIVKGFSVTRGPVAGILGIPDFTLKSTPYTLIVGSTAEQTVIIDVRNGNNDRDFANPANYSVVSGCVLN